MAEQLSMFEPPKRKSGLLYLPKYLTIGDQKDLLNDLRTVVRQAPLFTPTMSSGSPFRYKMTNIGDLGWVSDRKGYRYESRHPVTGQPYPEIPSSLRSMIADLSSKFGEQIRPDAVLLNWYPDGAKLGLHVDNTEKVSKPVVSLSLGDRGVFAIDTTGSRDRSTAMKNLERINVNSGDAIVFGGDLRNAYHAVERVDAGTASSELGMKNSGRINLTARQVYGFSTVPALSSSFLGTAGIVGGAIAGKTIAKTLGANEDQQNIAAGVGGSLGGLAGVATGYSGKTATMPTSLQDAANRALGVQRLSTPIEKPSVNGYDSLRDRVSQFVASPSDTFSFRDPELGSIDIRKDTVNGNKALLLWNIVGANSQGYDTSFAPKVRSNEGFALKSFRALASASDLPIIPAGVINPRIQRIFERSGYTPSIDDVFEDDKSPKKYIPKGLEYQRQDVSQEGKQGFEYGQKFTSPKSGESASLVTADMKGGAVLETLSGDRVQLTPEQYQKLSVKSPATLTSLKRGDGLILDQKGSQFDGQRYTVMGTTSDAVKLRTETGDIRAVPKRLIADNFRPNPLGISANTAMDLPLKFAKSFVMREGARLLAKQLGANEDQQQAVADTVTVANVAASFADNSRVNNMAANKKINTGSVSSSVKEPKSPKLTTDTLYKYLQMMGGDPVIVKPDGSQATKGKFAFGQDVGLNNEFTKLPEIHTRFDDPKIASMVAKELATGELTVGMQRNPETGEIETITKKFQPVPSRGNTQLRQYSLGNDPTGRYLAFNKPEEAYKAPPSLKELQADLRKSYKAFDLKPDATLPEVEAAVQPRLNEVKNSPELRDRLQTVLSDIQNRVTSEPSPIPQSPQQTLDTPSDAWKFPQQNERKLPNFYPQMASGENPLGTGATVQSTYDRAKSAYEGYQDFGYAPRDREFPTLREMKKLAESEGVKGDEAIKAYIKGKQNAPLIEAGVITPPELPMTARLGQEYISPKTGKIGTVESVGKKGVKLNVDGQAIPIEYETLERLKYTGNKQWGFGSMPALRPANAGLLGGTLGAIAFKQLAKAAGLNEDQQNIAAGVGGVTGAITGGSLSLFKPTTQLKMPTAGEAFVALTGATMPSFKDRAPLWAIENRIRELEAQKAASSESGMFLTAEGRNKMRLNQLNQYDVKPVLSDAAVIATDLLTPHPYGIATVPAARMATDSWKNNYDAIAERGLAAMKTTATGATSAIKDFTYQTLSQLGRSVGLPFPMTEQAVGQVLDAIPNAEQVMGIAKAKFARNSESGMVMMGDRPQTLSELQAARRELDAKYPDSLRYDRTAKPEPRKPVPFLTFDQSADQMSMSPSEYRAFQDRVYAEQKAVQSKPYQERQSQIAKQKFQQEQSYFDALKAWNKAGDPTIPMPRKEDFVSPIKNTFDFKQTLSEASMAARSAESRAKGFGKPQPKSAIAQATQVIQNAGEIVFDALYQPSAANPSRASSPKQSNFIAESEVQKAAAATGVSEARVKAEIANQRASGEAPNLSKATEAIATRTQSKELAPRSLAEMQNQSKALSNRVLSRQQSDGMITTPSQKMIDAGLKDQKVKLSDRIGTSGLGVVMDTAQAANVLTESVSRGENAPTALTRAGVSVGAGYAATGLASFIPNPYLRTAAQLGGGVAAVIGADKAIDAVVGRNEAKEQKYAKDLSKLDLQPTNESEQWKPFANDDNALAAYGNSFAAQIQSNLDYRPAARSLANLANNQSIENARYQSERQTSLQSGMDAKAKKSIAFEKRDDGTEVGYLRNRGYNATESRVLALQNLANEHGYEVPRTGKFEAKTLDALEKLGYSQSQISAYIQGKTNVIGKPNQVTPDKVNAAKIALARSRGEQVSSAELSAALSAERKAQGLKGGEMLNQGQVDRVFQSLAGRSLSQLRQSAKVGGNKTQSALRMGAGLR